MQTPSIGRVFSKLVLILACFSEIGFVHSSMAGEKESKKSDTIALSGTYGTLAYNGSVQRKIDGTNIQYVVKKLSLRFLPIIATNPVDQIHVNLVLTATRRPSSGEGPWKRIFTKGVDAGVTLTASAPSTILKDITFTIPQDVVTQADSVGVSVYDDRILWPFGEELK